MSSANVDMAIMAIEFEIRKKLKTLSKVSEKTELSENEKIKVGAEHEFISNIRKLIREFKLEMAANLGKVPPHDDEMEQRIIGCLMIESIEPTRFYKEVMQAGKQHNLMAKVKSILQPDHFYREAHRAIFEAIQACGETVDLMTVHKELRSRGQLDVVGGHTYLAECMGTVSQTVNVEFYARAVMEYAMRRQMIQMASEIQNRAFDESDDPHEIVDDAEKKINQAKEWRKK